MREQFFNALYNILKKDRNVILLTSDTGAIVLDGIRKDFSNRCINMGIAEENMISVAAGMAMNGKIVYVYAIIPFVTMRCYEQIRVDICCSNLPVKIIGVGAGVDFSTLGPTHHGFEDINIIRGLPGITIYSPSDSFTASIFAQNSYFTNGPVYVRLERYSKVLYKNCKDKFLDGVKLVKNGKEISIISTGSMIFKALQVAKELKSFDIKIIDLYRIKPLNEKKLLKLLKGSKYIFTLEEHSIIGGIGTAIAEFILENNIICNFKRIGIRDGFCRKYGTREYLHSYLGLDTKSISDIIKSYVCKK
jgi:transketolase